MLLAIACVGAGLVVPAGADPLSDASAALARRDYGRALGFFTAARDANLGRRTATLGRISALAHLGRTDEAKAESRAFVKQHPEDPGAWFAWSWVLFATGSDREARTAAETGFRQAPGSIGAANALAWLLATSPDATLRDGKRAVLLATRACEARKWEDGDVIDTLAAALATSGDFPKAAETQARALQKLDSDHFTDGKTFKQAKERLRLYRNGLPYHRHPPLGE